MKTKIIYLSVLFSFTTFFVKAQQHLKEQDVPSSAVEDFKKQYADASNVSWTKEDDNYNVFCISENQKITSTYGTDGEWLLSKFAISTSEIPSPANEYFKKNYKSKGYSIKNVQLVKEPGDKSYYCIEIKGESKNSSAIELFFDLEGNFLKKTEPIENVKETDNTADNSKPYVKTKEKTESIPLKEDNTQGESQKIDIPDIVKKTFNSKCKKAQDVKWEMADKNYLASYISTPATMPAGVKCKSEFTPKGEWLYTTEERDAKSLFPPVKDYIKTNYKSLKIASAEFTTKSNKEKFYHIKLIDKKSKSLNGPFTELFFNTAGKLTQAIEEEPEEVEEVVEKPVNKADEEFEKKMDNESGEDTAIYNTQEVNPKELPSPILTYISSNYDNKEWKIKKSIFVENENYGQIYYIELRKQGVKDPAELYFDMEGKYLKID